MIRHGTHLPAKQLALQFDAPLQAPTQPLRIVPAVHAVVVDAIATSAGREARRRELELYLRTSLGMRVQLTITDNRRNLFSWRRQFDHVSLRLHHMFLSAGPEATTALASYLGGARARLRDIRSFIRENMHQVRPVEVVATEQARGLHHDLRALYNALNQRQDRKSVV